MTFWNELIKKMGLYHYSGTTTIYTPMYPHPVLKIKKLRPEAIIPKYMTKGAVAFDVHSIDDVIVYPTHMMFTQHMKMVHTGLAVQLPPNHEMTIRQRSGMSLKFPNYIAICVGTIDEDYRGELTIPIINHSTTQITIKHGDRIAQCVVSPIARCKIEEVEELSETERGKRGFGSTDTKPPENNLMNLIHEIRHEW